MIARFAMLALLCAAAAPARAAPPQPATVDVTLKTGAGTIVLALERAKAPLTTANFLRYIDAKRFDGTFFYRATKVAPSYGLIQGGARNDPFRVFTPVAHEPTTKTGLSHVSGTISMARDAPGTATGDFFIVVGEMTSMDADPKAKGDNLGFAAFGHVVSGMGVVHKILDAPTSKAAGAGAMKGQMIADPIRIISARRGDG